MYRNIPSGAAMFPSTPAGDGYVESPPSCDLWAGGGLVVDDEEAFVLSWTLNAMFEGIHMTLFVPQVETPEYGQLSGIVPVDMQDRVDKVAHEVLRMIRS